MNIHVKDKNISGYIVVDGKEVSRTLQCVHGGEHFTVIHGSGVKRGYCTECKGVTCGSLDCSTCAPWQARLDLADAVAGRDSGETMKLLKRYSGIKPLF